MMPAPTTTTSGSPVAGFPIMNSASRRDNQGEPISRQCTDLSCKHFMLIDASIRILLPFAARLSIRANGKASHMSGLGD